MQSRFARARALFALAGMLAAAACKDQTPTLSGDQFFPGGSRPTTLETYLPSADFLHNLGVFSGYENARTATEQVVANQFGGVLNAHPLQRYIIPRSVTYSLNGTSTSDTLFTILGARLVVHVDTLGSAPVTTTLRLFPITQKFDWLSASWTLAVDSGSVHTPWTTPGGTVGAELASAAWTAHTNGDSLSLPIDTAQLRLLRPDSLPLLLAVTPAGTRLQLVSTVLRLDVRPSNAGKDTTISVEVSPTQGIFIFEPAPPAAGSTLQAGGVFADRSLFSLDLDQPLPGCAPADQPCPSVRLRDVRLNRVALVLRPLPVPSGFAALQPVPLQLWEVREPELGRNAPLVPGKATNGPVADSTVLVLPGASTVEVPITLETQLAVASDTLQRSFALLGQNTVGSISVRTFGLVRFEPTPRLRIIYTLPTRPRLP
jgi:hypothetical protein